MAPVKKPQPSTHKGRKPTTSTSSKTNNSRPKSNTPTKRPQAKQVKTKPTLSSTSTSKPKKKKATYTDAQLNLPAINGIVPATAHAKSGKGAGKKRNKVYVDDAEGMMAIMALVNAEKEGRIESRVLRARRLEEVREAKRLEGEKRAEVKRGRLEVVKGQLRDKNNKKRRAREKGEGVADGGGVGGGEGEVGGAEEVDKKGKKRKRVSFAS